GQRSARSAWVSSLRAPSKNRPGARARKRSRLKTRGDGARTRLVGPIRSSHFRTSCRPRQAISPMLIDRSRRRLGCHARAAWSVSVRKERIALEPPRVAGDAPSKPRVAVHDHRQIEHVTRMPHAAKMTEILGWKIVSAVSGIDVPEMLLRQRETFSRDVHPPLPFGKGEWLR